MAKLPQVRVCQMHCPVEGCPDLLRLPIETDVIIKPSDKPNTITCGVELLPDASAIWEHMFSKHGLVRVNS